MTTTTYYNLNIVEGTDIVNPLTVDNPNYEKIDEAMHDNAVSGVTLATEIANATVHAITRENSECAVIRFIATSAWKAGDTVTVDGVPVTALLPSGETLPNGAYVINANVLCILTGTNLTVYAERKKTNNANEIAYNETTVSAELDEINYNLSTKDVTWDSGEYKGSIVRCGNVCTLTYDSFFKSSWNGSYELGKVSSCKPKYPLHFIVPLYDGTNTTYLCDGILNIDATGVISLNTLGEAYNLHFSVTWVCQ